MSAFDPLAGIETEPMNLPGGIATREKSNPEDIASSETLIFFSPPAEKFAGDDGKDISRSQRGRLKCLHLLFSCDSVFCNSRSR